MVGPPLGFSCRNEGGREGGRARMREGGRETC